MYLFYIIIFSNFVFFKHTKRYSNHNLSHFTYTDGVYPAYNADNFFKNTTTFPCLRPHSINAIYNINMAIYIAITYTAKIVPQHRS